MTRREILVIEDTERHLESAREQFEVLRTMFKDIAEQEEREYNTRKQVQRVAFFNAIPKNAKSLYIHLQHRVPVNHHLVREIQENYGIENVLVTIAPEKSGQSFYSDSLDEIAEIEKRKRITEPFENFYKEGGLDIVIYLCDYICDGYQSPIFPDQVETKWHAWPAIKSAEEHKTPLIIGYNQENCFSGTIGVECYEREYLTGITRNRLSSITKERVKCPTKIIRIQDSKIFYPHLKLLLDYIWKSKSTLILYNLSIYNGYYFITIYVFSSNCFSVSSIEEI